MEEKDFGNILEKWENKTGSSYKTKKNNAKKTNKNISNDKNKKLMEEALKKYPIYDKDSNIKKTEHKHENEIKSISRKKLLDLEPEKKIDLHQMTTAEAENALDIFFEKAKKIKLKKILIVHGRGNHSKNGPVLKQFVKKYLEQHKFAGETGHPKQSEGGSGSTWVILKY